MRLRSMLFVPGDRPDEMAKALDAGADALILDLEESVAAAAKPEARRAVAEFLGQHQARSLWVRVNPLGGHETDKDLAAIVHGRPDGIVLPKAEGGASVVELARRLTERGNISAMILPLVTDAPSAIFQLGTYAGVKRLAGLTWDVEDLATALGASSARDEDGRYTGPCELARSLCLYGAAAAGVPALDTAYANFRDLDGLAGYAQRARRDGFCGMLAIHPDQVPQINAAFTPSEEEVTRAREIVEAFQANSVAGVLSIEGRMIDRPHLIQAQRILAAAAE